MKHPFFLLFYACCILFAVLFLWKQDDILRIRLTVWGNSESAHYAVIEQKSLCAVHYNLYVDPDYHFFKGWIPLSKINGRSSFQLVFSDGRQLNFSNAELAILNMP